jgi:hypothetical protein
MRVLLNRFLLALALAFAFAAIGAPLALYLATQVDTEAQLWMYGSRQVFELVVTAGLAFSDFVLLVPPAWLPLWLPARIVPMAKLLYVAFLGFLLLLATRTMTNARNGARKDPAEAQVRSERSRRTSVVVFLLGWLLVPAVLVVIVDEVRHTGTTKGPMRTACSGAAARFGVISSATTRQARGR